MKKNLTVEGLRVSVEGVEIIKGLDLAVPNGEVHALMGPNGSGKSTLANALMGHPRYEITSGSVTYGEDSIIELSPDERARKGIFLAFQYPQAIPGVRLQDFLRSSVMTVMETKPSLAEFMDRIEEILNVLKMDRSYLTRSVNDGFSGGEKKRAEILQMMMLKPRLAILDETDSGLDIDALRIVAKGIYKMRSDDFSALVITHYQRILNYLEPDKVHVLHRGRIVMSGGKELARELEKHGYDILKEEATVLAG